MRASAIIRVAVCSGFCLAAALTSAAGGPSKGPCGGDVTVSGPPLAGMNDPFNPSGFLSSTTLTITRASQASGGGKTASISFYLVPSASNAVTLPAGTTLSYSGVNILNLTNSPQSNPILHQQSTGTISAWSGSPSGYVDATFNGNNPANDAYPFTVSLSLPTGVNLPAGQTNYKFDMWYICTATGGYSDQLSLTYSPTAFVVSVNTLSALQAGLVGSNLDFGEIGATTTGGTTAQLPTDIWVKSNGPYSVSLTSCNNFQLYALGTCTAPTPGTNTVKYNLTFLGQSVGYGSTFTTTTCHAASVAGTYLPISAATAEAGKGKLPSNSYRDTLSLTFTPLGIAQDGAAVNCP